MVGLEGEGEWSMNCHHEKVSALREMLEVLDGQIHCQEFPIKRAVLGLCRLYSFLRRRRLATRYHQSAACCRSAPTAWSEASVAM